MESIMIYQIDPKKLLDIISFVCSPQDDFYILAGEKLAIYASDNGLDVDCITWEEIG